MVPALISHVISYPYLANIVSGKGKSVQDEMETIKILTGYFRKDTFGIAIQEVSSRYASVRPALTLPRVSVECVGQKSI